MSRPLAVLFPDNPTALAICRELGSSGIASIVLSNKRHGPAAQCRFSRFVRSPNIYQQPARWAEFTSRLGSTLEQQAVLFPTEDAGLLVAERYYESLSPSFSYSYAAPGVVSRILDKSKLYQAAAAAGVPSPAHHLVTRESEMPAADGKQWIAKPFCRYRLEEDRVHSFLHFSGGSKALAGDPAKAVSRILAAGFPAMLQESLPGASEDLISVGLCLSPQGEVTSSFTARKLCEYPQPFGDGLIVERIPDPGVGALAVRLLRELGYWGICDLEFKRDRSEGSFKLLDANPRGWLWMGLGAAGGSYLARAAYNLATGAPERPMPAPSCSLQRWVSPRSSLAFLLRCYRPRLHGLGLPAKLLQGSMRTAAFNWRSFHDPVYLKPSTWLALGLSLVEKTQRNDEASQLRSTRGLPARNATRMGGRT